MVAFLIAVTISSVLAQPEEEQILGRAAAKWDWQTIVRLGKQAEADGRWAFASGAYKEAAQRMPVFGLTSQATELARRAVDLGARAGDPDAEAEALHVLAALLPPEQGPALADRALHVLRGARRPVKPDSWLVVGANMTWGEGRLGIMEEAIGAIDKMGDDWPAMCTGLELRAARLEYLNSLGRFDEVRRGAQEMLPQTRHVCGVLLANNRLDPSYDRYLDRAECIVCELLLGLGDYDAAKEWDGLALTTAGTTTNYTVTPARALALLSWIAAKEGRDATATDLLGMSAAAWVKRIGEMPELAKFGEHGGDLLFWLPTAHYLRAYTRFPGVLEAMQTGVDASFYVPHPAVYSMALGVWQYYEGHTVEAEERLRAALREPQARGYCGDVHYSHSVSHLWLGRVLFAEGKIGEAEAELQEGFKGEKDAYWCWKPDYAEARVDYALAELQAGKAPQAEDLARKAADTARDQQDLAGQVDALGVLAVTLAAEGKAQEAAKAGEDAAGAAKQLADRQAKLWASSALAGVYSELGAEEMASGAAGGAEWFRWRRGGTTETLRQRARALTAQGNTAGAEPYLALALRIDKAARNAARMADDLYALARLAEDKGQTEAAEEMLGQAAQAAQDAGYKPMEADALVELMAARLAEGKTDKAAEVSARLDALTKELKMAPLEVRAGEVEGWLAEVKGDRETAAKRYGGAIDALERIRGGLTVEALHVGLMKAHAGLYGRMVAVLAQTAEEGKAAPAGVGNGEEAELTALHYAEAGRARALLAQMAGVFTTDLQGLSQADAAGMKTAEEDVAKSRQALWTEMAKTQADAQKAAALARDVRKKQGDADALRDRMLAKYPASALRAGREQVLGGAEVMQVCIDRTCAALEYWVGEDESWGWVVDPWKRQVKMFKVPMGRQELADAIGRLQKALTADPPAKEVADAAIAELSRALLGEAGAALPKGKRLVIVPDGPLNDLPFGLLTCQGQRLVERTTLSYLPSLSLLRALEEVRFAAGARQKASVLGRPKSPDPRYVDLPGTEDEAKAVGGELGAEAKVLVGDQATEAAAKQSARQDDILHLAAHGLLDRKQPAHSAILLTPGGGEDGLLEAGEVARLPIASKLVVLSACHGAGGGYVFGEGLVGMTRAFFAGGARAVVASPWQVPDKAAAEFMKAFYAQLKVSGEPARALQAAQIEMAQTSPAAVWAPFAYYGAP